MTNTIPQPTSPEYYAALNLYMAAKGVDEPSPVDELIDCMRCCGRSGGHSNNCLIRIGTNNPGAFLRNPGYSYSFLKKLIETNKSFHRELNRRQEASC